MLENLTRRLYVKKVKDWTSQLNKERFFDRKLDVKNVERGIILPLRNIKGRWEGGVCDNDFNFVAGYSRKEHSNGSGATWIEVISSYKVDHKDIVRLDEDVIFGGTLNGHFGHFLMESWCRLWFVVQHPELKLKILFVPSTHGGYQSWFSPFFELMGIDKERIIYVKQPTQCRSVIVPDQSQYWESFTKEWLLPFQAIKSRVIPSEPKKLYLTRTKLEEEGKSPEHIFNEKYFEDFFAAHGFEIVSMEKLKIEEQISLIMGADEIASTLGTLSHWAMFCKPDAKFIMLTRLHADHAPLQRIVNNIFGNYYIVDVAKNFMYAAQSYSVCIIGATKYWTKFVADYFGEKIAEDDDRDYLEESLDKYIDFWCKIYAHGESVNFDKLFKSLKKMCKRIIKLERKLANNQKLEP